MLLEDALDSIYEKNAQSIDGMVLGGIYKTLRTAGRLFMTNSRGRIFPNCALIIQFPGKRLWPGYGSWKKFTNILLKTAAR